MGIVINGPNKLDESEWLQLVGKMKRNVINLWKQVCYRNTVLIAFIAKDFFLVAYFFS